MDKEDSIKLMNVIQSLGEAEKELQEAYANGASKFRIQDIEEKIIRLEKYIHYAMIDIKNNN